LLDMVMVQGDGCHLAPAHVFNPWYSSLGSVSGSQSLAEVFGEGTTQIVAAERGLTSTPEMCRRVCGLDRHALFCCSDAHSLENLGRECTLLDIEPGYSALFEALRTCVIANLMNVTPCSKEVPRHYARVLEELGHERHILTEAILEEIAAASTRELARATITQRTIPPSRPPEKPQASTDEQLW
jgi:PHP family Zn ribbon phosphoesterase